MSLFELTRSKNEKENFKEKIKENGHTIRGLYHLVVSGKVIFVISPNAQCPIQTSYRRDDVIKNNGLHGLRVVWKSGGLTVEQI